MKCICGGKKSDIFNVWRIIIARVITEMWKKKNNELFIMNGINEYLC
jgi:hypothetical protein